MSGFTAWIVFLFCYTTVLSHRHQSTEYDTESDDNRCGASHGRRTRRHDRELFPRRPPSGNKYGSALQFETGQVIRYLKQRWPSKKFSVDFWMKPEGGQNNPSIVLHAYDNCAAANEARGWFIGLREASVTSDLRITFTVHSASAHSNKTIMSHSKLEAGRWVHVAATYDGIRMKLYINQAKVAVGYGQKGIIFDSTSQGYACDLLEIGGDIKRGLYYRGQIDKLRLWKDAISHRDISQSLPENTVDTLIDKLLLYQDFDENNIEDGHSGWIPLTDQYPRYVRSTVPDDQHDLSIRKPPCGKTICDNPEVIRSYLKHPGLRGSKHLRIRFIVVMNDDGSSPILRDQAIKSQFELMQQTFAPYNITWKLETTAVKNTWLRSKSVLHDCEVTMIGDGTCIHKCDLEITGRDGGDCGRWEECPPGKAGDGVCNSECNNARYNYDGGDCCKTPAMCVDPKSPNRGYLSIDDFKKVVAMDNRNALNVYIVNWTDANLQGSATFPWDKIVHTELGGVVMPPTNFDTTKVLIHELGHALGLWHVHHGSKSEMDCSSDCIESFPSLELGDLCSDTNPTIRNSKCSDPDYTWSSPSDTCGLPLYSSTPYDNFMSYANDSCINHFTPQQVARMHCYIDLDYQSWQINPEPSFVPLSPRVISATKNRVKLSWLPPLGHGGDNAVNLCNECEDGHVLEQYATTAYSPYEGKPNGAYAAHQAIGQPDAEHCHLSHMSWKPQQDSCFDCPLYLEVGFKQAVVPTELTIWVSYSAKDAFADIVLIYIDGSTESVGNGTAQCDSPFTKPLYVKKKVSKVRIYVSTLFVCIDAVKLTSGIGHPNCSKCKPLQYIIRREPPFENGNEIPVATARFDDQNVDVKGRYEYRVRAETHEGVSGPFSPPLIYEPKRGFCGDGKIDEGENCDDGNVRDGDGCNIQCQMEDVFHCDGRPSLCYRHEGDGICEEFEKQTSIKDCGFYTPEGSRDQWVDRATPNPKYAYRCSPDSIIGPPRAELKCDSDFHACDVCDDGWCPSNEDDDYEVDLWLNVYFKTPAIASAIVLYLSNVLVEFDSPPPLIKFELYGSGGNEKTILEHRLTKICKENPITIPILHDMTKPFFKTRYMKMIFGTDVKIAAVALRSPKHFDPVELQGCSGSQLFHPSTQKCHNYECSMPKCSKLMLKHSVQIEKCKKGSLEGDTCKVQCDKGFTPVAPFEVMCSSGEWKVDGEVPRCTPVDCGKPRIQNAETDCSDGTTFGKKCLYKCKKGTKQAGGGSELSVTCEADGLWSATNTFCRKTCSLPPTPPHSRLLLTSKNCNKGKPFIPGESCKYRCKIGYRPSGFYQKDLYRKGDFIQRCLKGGSWTTKRCVPVRCPIRDPKIFRWYNCTQGNKFGSVCRLACPDEKVREVKCSAEGKWDEKFQFCSTKKSCPPPRNVNMDLTVSCGKHMKPGDECKIECASGYMPVVKGDVSRQHLQSITCSPFLKWFPALNDIKCSVMCDEKIMNDGDCDGVNNNAECQYDGGDCCNPYVEKMKTLCGYDCDCRDPTSPFYGMEQSGDGRFSN